MRTLLAALLLVPSLASASTWYVAPTGKDTNAGTDALPFLTLQKAANSVKPGDTVIARAGTYRGFDVRVLGTASAPVLFKADPGVTVNQDNPVNSHGINVEDSAYVTIDGFTVVGATRAGIRCALSPHVTVRRNTCDQNGYWGIFSGFCDDLLVEDNQTSRSVNEHGIYHSNSADRPIIRRNLSWGNRGNGIHMNGDLSQGGDGIISNARVEGNLVYENGAGGGSGINCDGVQDSVIQNNVLYDNHASGISLYMIDAADGARRNKILNNTIVMAAGSRWAINIKDASTDATVVNNILLNKGTRGSINITADSLGGLVSSNNLVKDLFSPDDGNTFIGLAAWKTRTGQEQASIVAGTLASIFVSEPGHDLHLTAGSAAIDTGTANGAPSLDRDGRPRPLGAALDIGAFEYCAGASCAAPPADAGTASLDGSLASGVDASVSAAGADAAASSADGGTGAGAPDSGCGCGSASSAAPLVALAALVLLRRRVGAR